jgi:RES domain-containing protein
MIVYHLGRTKYASDTTGEGARLNGGRWNPVGIPCIYTSENRALTVLEYSANVPLFDIPRSLSITTFQIPDGSWMKLNISELPGNWNQNPVPKETMEYGAGLLKTNQFLALRIPSAILPEEFNYIINPQFADIGLVKIIDVRDFAYDIRVKKA